MYKFVIKGIDGTIKYVSKNNYYSVDAAQFVGHNTKIGFTHQNRYSITKSDTIDVVNASEVVENECINSELSNNLSIHLLVQQY